MFTGTINTEYYPAARPFPCAKLDGLVPPWLLDPAAACLPALKDEPWIYYDTPLEKKLVLEGDGGRGELRNLYAHLQSDEFVHFLSEMCEIPGLVADRSLYGGGLSVVRRGGKLDLHRDLSLHPKTGLERRLNLALFLNKSWDDAWGGHLELWSEKDLLPYRCVRRFRPTWGRIVLFDPKGYHGFPDPITCPDHVERASVQLFYYAAPRAGAPGRKRAAFAPRPGDAPDAELDKFRMTRAGLSV